MIGNKCRFKVIIKGILQKKPEYYNLLYETDIRGSCGT